MTYIDTLRANGYHALAQYCKMREKFNSVPLFEANLTPVEHRWLLLSGLPALTNLIESLVDNFLSEGYCQQTLMTMNEIAKREIIRSQAAHFSNEYHHMKAQVRSWRSEHYPELRAWFENIAQKNNNQWGIAAENVVKLIDKRMQRLGE